MKKFVMYFMMVSLMLTGCASKKTITADSNQQASAKETISTPLFEMHFDKQSKSKSIEPQAPKGYYHEYKEVEDKIYFLLEGTLKNTSQQNLDFENVYCELIGKDTTYEGRVRFEAADKTDLISTIQKGEQLKCKLFFLIPLKSNETYTSIKFFYDTTLQKHESNQPYEQSLTIKL